MGSPAMGGAGGQTASAATGGAPTGGKGGGATGPSYEGLDAFQQSAQGLTQAYGGMQDAMNYQPMMVQGGTYDPMMASGGGAMASMLDPNSTDYQAAQFQQADLDRFMNPYTGQVIDQSLADIERSRLQQANQAAAQATAAGAFGGSRGALMEAEIARNALDQSASTAANLRNQGFQFAAQQGQQDAARRQQALAQNAQQQLQSMLANQASGLAASQTNAQLGTQASIANQQAYNLAQEFGLNQGLEAALANQGAGLQGAQMQLSGAQGLGALSNLGFGMGQSALANMQEQGAMQQMLNQMYMDKGAGQFGGYQAFPQQALGYYAQALGASQIPQSQTTSSNPGVYGWASMLLSDVRLKKNIRRVGTTPGGHNLYAWDWKKKAKSILGKTGADMGVLAQEVMETRPDLVVEFPDGFYRVNYGGIS